MKKVAAVHAGAFCLPGSEMFAAIINQMSAISRDKAMFKMETCRNQDVLFFLTLCHMMASMMRQMTNEIIDKAIPT